MDFQDVELPGMADSLGITFACKGCGASFSMVTNAGETQMVKSLGVSLGGREEPANAFELTQAILKDDGGAIEPVAAAAQTPAPHPTPADGAALAGTMSESMGKCPFANKMATQYVKESAPPTGESMQVGGVIGWSDGAMTRLQNVPSEIRPIARQLIEGMARDQGLGQVDDALMDLARDTFM